MRRLIGFGHSVGCVGVVGGAIRRVRRLGCLVLMIHIPHGRRLYDGR